MRYIFFGSFHVARDILRGLLDAKLTPAAIVCSPDRPAGRKKIITPPATKSLILESKLPITILQPEKVADIATELKAMNADFFVVMGYPQIIPQSILDIPHLGTIGVHPSLLPKYRGASPMQSALLAGEQETGVTLYVMDAKMDHGPIISAATTDVSPEETNESLERKLAALATTLLVKTLPAFYSKTIQPHEQNHTAATFTRKFETKDAEVDFAHDEPLAVYRKIQALNPEPGVYTFSFPGYEGKRVKLLAASYDGTHIHITRIQPDGKKPFDLTG